MRTRIFRPRLHLQARMDNLSIRVMVRCIPTVDLASGFRIRTDRQPMSRVRVNRPLLRPEPAEPVAEAPFVKRG
jgi:hypothetical protein